jgi:hypothetical protein
MDVDDAPGVQKCGEASKTRRAKARAVTDPAREAAIQKRADAMPPSTQRNYLRATRGEASPRSAIKAFCLECVGWERDAVAECTGFACPLWAYRPSRRDRGSNDNGIGCQRAVAPGDGRER